MEETYGTKSRLKRKKAEPVPCPICQGLFYPATITQHADACAAVRYGNTVVRKKPKKKATPLIVKKKQTKVKASSLPIRTAASEKEQKDYIEEFAIRSFGLREIASFRLMNYVQSQDALARTEVRCAGLECTHKACPILQEKMEQTQLEDEESCSQESPRQMNSASSTSTEEEIEANGDTSDFVESEEQSGSSSASEKEVDAENELEGSTDLKNEIAERYAGQRKLVVASQKTIAPTVADPPESISGNIEHTTVEGGNIEVEQDIRRETPGRRVCTQKHEPKKAVSDRKGETMDIDKGAKPIYGEDTRGVKQLVHLMEFCKDNYGREYDNWMSKLNRSPEWSLKEAIDQAEKMLANFPIIKLVMKATIVAKKNLFVLKPLIDTIRKDAHHDVAAPYDRARRWKANLPGRFRKLVKGTCGQLNRFLLSALYRWQTDAISTKQFLELVRKKLARHPLLDGFNSIVRQCGVSLTDTTFCFSTESPTLHDIAKACGSILLDDCNLKVREHGEMIISLCKLKKDPVDFEEGIQFLAKLMSENKTLPMLFKARWEAAHKITSQMQPSPASPEATPAIEKKLDPADPQAVFDLVIKRFGRESKQIKQFCSLIMQAVPSSTASKLTMPKPALLEKLAQIFKGNDDVYECMVQCLKKNHIVE